MNREHPQITRLAWRRQQIMEARRLGKVTEEKLLRELTQIEREEALAGRNMAAEAAFRQTFDREHGLTDKESEALTLAILDCSCTTSSRYLHILLEDWATFVARVEAGYNDIWDEYRFYLNSRSYLQRIVDSLHFRTRWKLMEAIAPLDKRFQAVTQPSRMMEAASDRNGDVWWWERVLPRNPGAQLVESMSFFADLDPPYRSDPH